MFKIKDISIRGKLIIMQVFTSLLVLSIFFAVYVLTDIRDYKERKVNSITSLAKVIAANSVSTLLFQDNEAAKQILYEVQKVSPEIIYAEILDNKGMLFTSYKKPGIDSSFVFPPSIKEKSYEFTKKDLFVRNQIIDNDKIVGEVVLAVELTELESIKQSKYKIATILLMISVAFSFLVGAATQPYISKRLLLLVNKMQDVKKTGKYVNLPVDKGKDEISILFNVFNSLMQQISENEKRKDEFIGIASHELKTPLTTIKGYLELLKELEKEHLNKQFVQKASENVNKLELLIRDLLDVSKIQSGQLQLNMGQFEIDELIDDAISSLQMITPTHEIMREDRINQTVFADRQRIEQVLVNLLSNAIKYSPGENKVLVGCKKSESEITIMVRDYGIGIPKEEQSYIFNRFYRTKEMSVHISGFGLGLYICKDIISRHKGKIWVQSEVIGSSFYFTLPLTMGLAVKLADENNTQTIKSNTNEHA